MIPLHQQKSILPLSLILYYLTRDTMHAFAAYCPFIFSFLWFGPDHFVYNPRPLAATSPWLSKDVSVRLFPSHVIFHSVVPFFRQFSGVAKETPSAH